MAATIRRSLAAPEILPVTDVTPEKGERMLDEAARHYLGISGETFRQRWESGYYAKDPDGPGVQVVRALLSFARTPPAA